MASWPLTDRYIDRRATERIYIERLPAGWRVAVNGVPQTFGTSFLAIHTADAAARDVERAGRRCEVMIQREDGSWRGVQRFPDCD